MNINMRKWALATREAHIALLDLRRLVEEAARMTHAAEFEAVRLPITPQTDGDVTSTMLPCRFAQHGTTGNASLGGGFSGTEQKCRESAQVC
jgi:hypothetical protein